MVKSKFNNINQGSEKCLRPNIVGIVGGIVAFVSLVLPWWTMTESGRIGNTTTTTTITIYTYTSNLPMAANTGLWYGWVALAFVVTGGLLAIVGSLIKNTRLLLVASGVLVLISMVIFAVGLQTELSESPIGPVSSLFASGSFTTSLLSFSYTVDYLAYLTLGFWLALISAILMFTAFLRERETSGIPRTEPTQAEP